MADLSLTCPYFNTEKAGFSICSAFCNPIENTIALVFLTCNLSYEGIIVKLRTFAPHFVNTITSYPYVLRDQLKCQVIEINPEAKPLIIPPHLPENVANTFLQAKTAIINKLWDAAGVMCRKVLERTLSNIYPEMKGKKLIDRINKAAETGLITISLRDWAHRVRIDGNEAAHEDDFNEQESIDLVNFTEMLLTYLFSLPGMIKEKKEAVTT
jgi:hypothetical protein